MGDKGVILVGTLGESLFRSEDGGEAWEWMGLRQGFHTDGLVRAFANVPDKPEVVYAGTDLGLYRSEDTGRTWKPMDSPATHVWTITVDPADSRVLFVGTGSPIAPAVYRSNDAGKTWDRRPLEVSETCPNVSVPRVSAIAIDPADSANIWLSLEVDGVRHSTDGGDTWEPLNAISPNPDVHNAMVVSNNGAKTVFIVFSDDMYTSKDNGGTWKSVDVQNTFPWGYIRGIAARPDNPDVVFVTAGDFIPGWIGTVMRSKDGGGTWEELSLPVQPNSTMWTISINPADSNVVYSSSMFGYLYRSDDGGDSWKKLWREFGEVYTIMCIPN